MTSAPTDSRRRILAIDDVPAFTRMLKLNLETTGEYRVRVVNDSSQAVAAALEFEPDLILLDLVMPEADGETIATELAAQPETASIPILFLTAMARARPAAPPLKENRILSKPVARTELIEAIDEALEESA